MSLLTDDFAPRARAKPETTAPILPSPVSQRMSDAYQIAKSQTYAQVIEQLETRGNAAGGTPVLPLREEIEMVINSRSRRGQMALNSAERLLLIEDIEDEVNGFGPLAPLLRDPKVDDIIVNGPHRVYVEREGKLHRVETRFQDDAHLMTIIHRIVGQIGRRVDEANPYVDARLADGSRVNIVIPPVAIDGAMLSVRKFRMQTMSIADFVERQSMSSDMADYLAAAVRGRLNILVCGGTGAGKTTLLNMLSSFIDQSQRLITIEDAAELQLRQDHVVRLETRPGNLEGSREIGSRELLRNALRMRPDRIILGEVRGVEAVEMLQAMSTGHDGSMATIHGNSPRDAFSRLEMLLGFAGLQSDIRAIRRFIASSVHLVVQVQRLTNGSRRIMSVTEVTGVEGEAFSLNELFSFEEQPPMSGLGEFRTASFRSHFAERIGSVRHDRQEGRLW